MSVAEKEPRLIYEGSAFGIFDPSAWENYMKGIGAVPIGTQSGDVPASGNVEERRYHLDDTSVVHEYDFRPDVRKVKVYAHGRSIATFLVRRNIRQDAGLKTDDHR